MNASTGGSATKRCDSGQKKNPLTERLLGAASLFLINLDYSLPDKENQGIPKSKKIVSSPRFSAPYFPGPDFPINHDRKS